MTKDITRVPPDQIMGIMRQINESMFGQRKWNEMVEQANSDMQKLIGIGVISKRDKVIFHFALHFGIKFGIAYSHALRNAQRPLHHIRNLVKALRRKK